MQSQAKPHLGQAVLPRGCDLTSTQAHSQSRTSRWPRLEVPSSWPSWGYCGPMGYGMQFSVSQGGGWLKLWFMRGSTVWLTRVVGYINHESKKWDGLMGRKPDWQWRKKESFIPTWNYLASISLRTVRTRRTTSSTIAWEMSDWKYNGRWSCAHQLQLSRRLYLLPVRLSIPPPHPNPQPRKKKDNLP